MNHDGEQYRAPHGSRLHPLSRRAELWRHQPCPGGPNRAPIRFVAERNSILNEVVPSIAEVPLTCVERHGHQRGMSKRAFDEDLARPRPLGARERPDCPVGAMAEWLDLP